MLRRATGQRPPSGPRRGKLVFRGTARSTDDVGLASATLYSYSLFVRRPDSRRWAGPVALSAFTTGIGGTGTAEPSYAIAAHAVVVDAGDGDTVSIKDGQLWLHVASWRPKPQVGAGVILPVSSKLPGGFLGKVAEVAADGRTARVVQGSFVDVFARLDLDTDIPTTTRTSAITAASGTVRTSRTSRATGPSSPCTLGGVLTFSDPTVTVGGHLEIKVESSWGIPQAVVLDAAISPGIRIGVTGKSAIDANCTLKLGDPPPLPIWIGPVSTIFTFKPRAELKASFEGTTSFNANASVSLGAQARFGKDPYFHPSFNKSSTVTGETGVTKAASIKIGGEISWGPGVGNGLAGAEAGIYGELDPVALTGTVVSSGCYKFQWGGEADAGFDAKVWAGPLSAKAKYQIFDGSWTYGEPTYKPSGCQNGPLLPTVTAMPDMSYAPLVHCPSVSFPTQISIQGSHFSAHEPYSFEIAYAIYIGVGMETDANGNLQQTVDTPHAPHGNWQVEVDGQTHTATTTTGIGTDTCVSVSGGKLGWEGNGWRSGDQVTFTLDGVQVGTATADDDGSFDTAPATTCPSGGTHSYTISNTVGLSLTGTIQCTPGTTRTSHANASAESSSGMLRRSTRRPQVRFTPEPNLRF